MIFFESPCQLFRVHLPLTTPVKEVIVIEITLPEINSSHLKIDGWKTTFLLGRPFMRCYVSFRECRDCHFPLKHFLLEDLRGNIQKLKAHAKEQTARP